MPLSPAKSTLFAAFLLLPCAAFGAPPPDLQMASAASAITIAQHQQPRGPAAELLAQAQARFVQAQAAFADRKFRDAASLADEAHAAADLAAARARLANAQMAVDEKAARNADLRRQLLVLPEANP